jgi:hypothetical protein
MTSLEIVSFAGLLAGTLDLAATSTVVRAQGVRFEQLLQMIASGAFGPAAFKGGKKTAVMGLFFHFLIALTAALIYYAISRRMTALIDYPFFSSVIFGSAVHLIMSRIVIPLSAAPKRKFSARAFLTQLLIHVLCVGLPIALIVSHFSR